MRTMLAVVLLPLLLAGCIPGLSKQEQVRRQVIGKWDTAAGDAYTFNDGGAFSAVEGRTVSSGQWSVSDTGGIAVVLSGGSLAAQLQGDTLILTAPQSTATLVRESALAKTTPRLTNDQASQILLVPEKADTQCARSGSFDMNGDDATLAPLDTWLASTFANGKYVSFPDPALGGVYYRDIQHNQQDNSSGATSIYNIRALDYRDGFQRHYLTKVLFCAEVPAVIAIDSRTDVSPAYSQITFHLSGGAPLTFEQDLAKSPYAGNVPPFQPGPQKNADLRYKSPGGWQLAN